MSPAPSSISTDSQVALGTDAQRYETLLRISEALSTCREPGELPRILADSLRDLISFDYLDVFIFKENSDKVQWHVVGDGQSVYLDVPIEEAAGWHFYNTQEPLFIADWSTDSRFPRLKQLLEKRGLRLDSVIRVPLTTAHRRLGTLGISSQGRNAYRSEDVSFLQLLSGGVALAIDDEINLRKSQAARLELERQNTRLKLLLDLTARVTSNLDLNEVLQAISVSVRTVMQCDAVGITLPDRASDMFRLYALDFPHTKGFAHDVSTVSPASEPIKKAMGALRPVVSNHIEAGDFSPETYAIITGEGLEAVCDVPLVSRGRALGVLSLGRREENSFNEDDVEFLTLVAGQIAIAVENALAYHEISQLKDKLARVRVLAREEEVHDARVGFLP